MGVNRRYLQPPSELLNDMWYVDDNDDYCSFTIGVNGSIGCITMIGPMIATHFSMGINGSHECLAVIPWVSMI